MSTKLKVLLVEDRAADAELVLHELRRAGYDPEWTRVETEAEFLAQIGQGWDIILADYNLPEFSGLRALELLREREPDLPFILVSGTIGEDNAVAALKAGANYYVMKDRLVGLGPAVERELREAIEQKKRKWAEAALRASETRYHLLIEKAQFPIVVVSAQDLRVLFINDHASHLFGVPAPQAIGMRVSRFWCQKEDLSRFIRLIQEEGEVKDFETELHSKYSAKMTVMLSSNVIEYAGRQANITVFQDISDRKRKEEQLQESEKKYKLLADNATDIVWTMTLGTNKFTYFSPSVQKLRGYTPAEAMEIPLDKTVTPDSYKRVLIEIGEALEREKAPGSDPDRTSQYEFQQFRKDGSIVSTEARVKFLHDANGRPTSLLGISRDITERQRTQEALRNAEKNFRLSLDESPLGIRIVSAEGETIYANRAILDFFGYADLRELNQIPLRDRYTPESYADFRVRDRQRKNGENAPSEYEISIVRKTGEIRHLQVFRKEIIWDGQKRYQSIYQDVTERRKAEASLQKTLLGLRKALAGIIQVLASVSEIRDPYTAGHQRRVADLARAIAQEMGLSPDRVEGIRVTGLIHDIGKMSIPAEILSKPALLSKIEYALIQSHAQIGHDILSEIEFAWPIAKMILQHHERMDGSGYPQRLKGDDIMLESRILAVADVIEAMASHRPYRPSLGIEAALREIENDGGVLFDPAVVAACLRLFREKGYKLKD